MNDFCDDINFSNLNVDSQEKEFNLIIGHIEDILISEKFQQLNNTFMEKYWQEFDDKEENKFIYTDIFKEYQDTIEKYIEDELRRKVTNFSMEKLEEELKKRENELDGEIFELLSTFTDFVEFKAMFLDYKAMKDGHMIDFSKDFCVSKYVAVKNS